MRPNLDLLINVLATRALLQPYLRIGAHPSHLISYYCLILIIMDSLDIQNLQLPRSASEQPNRAYDQPPRHKSGEKFLKGPIPMNWLNLAGQQAGKSLHVAIGLWYLAGLTNCRTVRLSGKVLSAMGVTRHTGYRGIAALEDARLISVIRHPGRCPVITLLDPPGCPETSSTK